MDFIHVTIYQRLFSFATIFRYIDCLMSGVDKVHNTYIITSVKSQLAISVSTCFVLLCGGKRCSYLFQSIVTSIKYYYELLVFYF